MIQYLSKDPGFWGLSLKGEMKGSAIIVQFTKECAELFSKFAFNANSDEKKQKKETKKIFWILNSHWDFVNLVWIFRF